MRARAAIVILVGLALIVAGLAYYVSSTSTGTLAVQLRDAPMAWSHVVLSFSDVRVLPAGAPKGSGWLSLPLQITRIDFLPLINLTQLVALGRLSPGTYSAVRIELSGVSGVLPSGASVSASLAGGFLESEATINIRGGGTTTVILDLNLAQSISQGAAGWVFRPVMGPIEIG